MTRKATLTDRPTDGRGIAVTTIDGVVLDGETTRRDDSDHIIVKSQRGDHPKAVSITDIGIYPYRHTDLQLALKWRNPLRKVKTTPDRQDPSRFVDLPGCVFAPGEPPTLIDSAGNLWAKYCRAKTDGIPDAASIEVEPARLQELFEQGAWRRNWSRISSARPSSPGRSAHRRIVPTPL
ncbi:MAG: hypothetical protein F4Y37_03235 [Caldilineaceae bacterium SB0664_bin_22]|nr:hypothetical protein [Caldilineaceae bacterium SB0664_bin_22]MYC64441.1 hypothetical protein [Caldilineaceae bacterium SB0661_bin_34]